MRRPYPAKKVDRATRICGVVLGAPTPNFCCISEYIASWVGDFYPTRHPSNSPGRNLDDAQK